MNSLIAFWYSGDLYEIIPEFDEEQDEILLWFKHGHSIFFSWYSCFIYIFYPRHKTILVLY